MEITTKLISAGLGEPRSPPYSIWRPIGHNESTPAISALSSTPSQTASPLQFKVRTRATAHLPRDLAPALLPQANSLLVPCPGWFEACCQSSLRRNPTSLSEQPPVAASQICTPPTDTSVSGSSCPRSGPGPHHAAPHGTHRRPRERGTQNKTC